MTYSFLGINNYMYGLGGMQNCCRNYSPFMFYNNYLYNPFTVFNTAMQLMNGNIPNIFNYNSYQPRYENRSFDYNYSIPQIQGKSSLNFNSLYDGLSMYSAKDYSKIETPSFGSITSVYSPSYRNESDLYSSWSNNTSLYDTKSYKTKYTTLSSSHLNKEFLDKVKTVSKKINCDYEDLLAVMNSESSLNPSSAYKNKKDVKTAVGLIQFTKEYAIPDLNKNYGLDLTVEKIENMSAMKQLDLVEKYYKLTTKKFGGKKLSAADLYASTYLPGRSQNNVLCKKGETNSSGKLLNYYESNKTFDKNNDGVITKSELNQHLAGKRVNLSTFA